MASGTIPVFNGSSIVTQTYAIDNISISANSNKYVTFEGVYLEGYKFLTIAPITLLNATSSGTGRASCGMLFWESWGQGSAFSVGIQLYNHKSTASKVKATLTALFVKM